LRRRLAGRLENGVAGVFSGYHRGTMTEAAPALPMPDADAVRDILRTVVDPELGANIVDLGLVYRIDITPGQLVVEMTMTSPACPLGGMIVDEVNAALAAALSPDWRSEVRLVWEPAWDPSMMSERTKLEFGW